jgi:hypothetical protein
MRAEEQMDVVARATSFRTAIMGVAVEVQLTIKTTYVASFDFTLNGSPYTFCITKWSGRGFAKFATLFFKATERDASQFGSFSEAPDGMVSYSMSTAQKLNLIEQSVKDVLACVDIIGRKYNRSVLDYAVWYREKHTDMDTYELYITRSACCAIVHVDFLAPNVQWELVHFMLPTLPNP